MARTPLSSVVSTPMYYNDFSLFEFVFDTERGFPSTSIKNQLLLEKHPNAPIGTKIINIR